MNTRPDTVETNIPEGAFSVEDLEMLHPNERAAIEADDAPAQEEGEKAAAEAEAQPEQPPADPAPAAQPAEPPPHARLAELQGQVDAAKTALDELAQKYDDGEITSAEWREQLTALTAKQAKAMAAVETVQAQVQTADEAWYGMVRQSMERLSIQPQTAQLAIYDSILRKIEEGYPTLPDAEKVRAAEIQYQQLYGGVTPKPTPTGGQGKPAAPKTPEADPEDAESLGTVPPSLAGMPAAAYDGSEGPHDSVQSLIDRGDVYAAESAIARMSPADLDRFLARG